MPVEWISAREAAARWGVHIRVVQNLCRAGRVPEARKYGNVWMLPADASKPTDPRRARRTKRPKWDGSGLLTMASVSLPKGVVAPPEALTTAQRRQQLAAEFAFLRGDMKAGLQALENAGRGSDMALCAAALTMASASRTNEWERFCETDAFLQEVFRAGDEPERKLAEIALALALLSQFATEMVPPWILNGLFSYAPPPARPMCVYMYAKSLQGRQRTDEVLAVCKTGRTLWARDDSFTMLDVYLSLLLAAASHAKGDSGGCRRALEQAAELALPYGFITPFAEYRRIMESEMDELFRRRRPELLAPMQTLGVQMWRDWNAFHARFIRTHLQRLLSPLQHRAARLIARGESHRDAARELGISVGELKQTMAEVYQKLLISNREQLVDFML